MCAFAGLLITSYLENFGSEASIYVVSGRRSGVSSKYSKVIPSYSKRGASVIGVPTISEVRKISTVDRDVGSYGLKLCSLIQVAARFGDFVKEYPGSEAYTEFTLKVEAMPSTCCCLQIIGS